MKYPDFSFEKRLWNRELTIVGGVDEVGRGCFAGPVVAAAVAFTPNSNFQIPIFHNGKKILIDDSKKLKPRQREIATRWIKENVLTWGIGSAAVAEINKKGMAKASKSAFRRAIYAANKRLGRRIEFLLIDAFYIPYVNGAARAKQRQLAIINGDEKSLSIAAASIIAKVHRDKLMRSLSKKSNYKKYGWGRNKGYGTKEHTQAIRKYGLTRFHRRKFVESYLNNLTI